MNYWRWRLLVQQPDEPPAKRVITFDDMREDAYALLRVNPTMTVMRLMLTLRCGYRRAEKLIEDFKDR